MEPLKLSGRMRTINLDADGRAADPAYDADAVADAIHCYRQWLRCYDLANAATAAGDHALADTHNIAGDICYERGANIYHDLDAAGQAEVARRGCYGMERAMGRTRW